jgi:hypothetical protein
VARTVITPTIPAIGGTAAAPVSVDAAASPNGMQVAQSAHICMRVITTGTVIVVTVQTPRTLEGNTITPTVTTCTATGTMWIPLNRDYMKQTDGNVYLNFNTSTGGTVECIDMGA